MKEKVLFNGIFSPSNILTEGLEGLKDRSRRPHRSPNRLDDSIRARIIRLKKKMPHCGANRMRTESHVPASSKTIQKVFRAEGFTRAKRSKRSKQRDLRKWKEQHFAPLKYWQVVTKDCSDIPYYLERIHRAGFPRYLYQARYVQGHYTVPMLMKRRLKMQTRFMERLMAFIISFGVDVAEVVFQIDNGTEYISNSPDLSHVSLFEDVVAAAGARLVRIPPGLAPIRVK